MTITIPGNFYTKENADKIAGQLNDSASICDDPCAYIVEQRGNWYVIALYDETGVFVAYWS